MLTERQRETLIYIQDYQQEFGGVSPTFSKVAAAIGVASKSSVRSLLSSLEQRGYITRLRNRSCAITVIRPIERYQVFKFNRETKSLDRVG